MAKQIIKTGAAHDCRPMASPSMMLVAAPVSLTAAMSRIGLPAV